MVAKVSRRDFAAVHELKLEVSYLAVAAVGGRHATYDLLSSFCPCNVGKLSP